MGRNAAEVVDGTAFKKTCDLLGVRSASSTRVLGISRRSFHKYCQKSASVTDKTLALVIRRLLGIADGRGVGKQVRLLLRSMVEPAVERMLACRAELTAGQMPHPAIDPLPLVSAELQRGGSAMDAGFTLSRQGRPKEADAKFREARQAGERAIDVWIARGHNWFDNGLIDQSIRWFENAFRVRPDDEALALCVAKAHLEARKGDPTDHWNRARTIIQQNLKRGDTESALWNQWRFWEVVAIARDPRKFDDPNNYLEVARRLERLQTDAEMAGDWPVATMSRSLHGVALFRTGIQENMVAGAESLARFIRTLNSKSSTFQRGVALKRMANMLLYLAPSQPRQKENLHRAVKVYERACGCFAGQRLKVDFALTKYSQGAAYLALGSFYTGTDNAIARRYFLQAEQANLESQETLTREGFPDDWARIEFNLAQSYDYRPAAAPLQEILFLQRAIFHYERSMQVFHKGYIFIEWMGTLTPLVGACQRLSALTELQSDLRRYRSYADTLAANDRSPEALNNALRGSLASA